MSLKRDLCLAQLCVSDTDVFKLQHRSSEPLNPSDQSSQALRGFISYPNTTISVRLMAFVSHVKMEALEWLHLS